MPGYMLDTEHYAHLIKDDDKLLSCIRAIGLTAYARTSGHTQPFTRLAMTAYTDALIKTKAALQIPEQAITTNTLTTVILFALLEYIDSPTSAVVNHVNGALEIIRLRGSDLLRSEAGRIILHQFGFFYVMASTTIVDGFKSPEPLLEYLSDRPAGSQGYLCRYNEVMIRFALLFGDYKRGTCNNNLVFERAQEMEQQLRSLVHDSSPDLSFEKSVVESATHLAPDGLCHFFSSIWAARMRNHVRACILLTNEMVADVLERGLHSDCSLFGPKLCRAIMSYCQIKMDKLRDEILASVPATIGYWSRSKAGAFLGHWNTPTRTRNSVSAHPETPGGQHNHLNLFHGSLLLWPLFTVALGRSASASHRAFVRTALLEINKKLGTHQALNFAQMAETLRQRSSEGKSYGCL